MQNSLQLSLNMGISCYRTVNKSKQKHLYCDLYVNKDFILKTFQIDYVIIIEE